MISLSSPAATEAFGEALARQLRPGDCIALSGPLGAGKTTLARGLLRGLGFRGEVASPTFPIVLAYDPPEVRMPFWHVDLYRIEDAADAGELGLEEACDAGAMLVEWPERLDEAFWTHSLRLALTVASQGERSLTAQVPAAWEGRWPPS